MKSHRHYLTRTIALPIIFLSIFNASSLFADDIAFEPVRPEIISAKTAGYAGDHSALEAGFDTLTTNPAALAYVTKEWSFSRIATRVSGPLFDIPSIIQSNDVVTGLLDLVAKNKGIYFGANITGPLAFGKVDKNFGFGVFNRTLTSADIPSLTSASLVAGEEFLLTGGYGITLYEKENQSIAAGVQLKGFFQTFLMEKGTSLSVLGALTNFQINNLPTALSTGFGLDAGFMYRNGPFNAGLTCKDLYTPVFTTQYSTFSSFTAGSSGTSIKADRLDPYLSAGIEYSFPIPDTWISITGWKAMADYRDILDLFKPIYRNPILNATIGTEVVFLDVISLRAGINETYLSTGIGLDLTLFQIDLAMYGSELGIDPGKRPLLNMDLSLSFQY